ncbi:hypothetical protein L195_g061384, partial [Trifolium pratense]
RFLKEEWGKGFVSDDLAVPKHIDGAFYCEQAVHIAYDRLSHPSPSLLIPQYYD